MSVSGKRAEPALQGAGEVPGTFPLDFDETPVIALRGRRLRVRSAVAALGPAFIAAVAYVDPGNFAINLQAGARYGYQLMWVILLSNLVAMLVQYLSAKLGVITGKSLPELLGASCPRPLRYLMWIQAELMAMATDIAEFLGAAIGLNLLFGVPPAAAGLITAVIAFALLGLHARGRRRFELAITALLGIVFAGFLYQTLKIGPSAHQTLTGLIPSISSHGALYLAVGIVGATVMPHVIYLHSALTGERSSSEAGRSRGLRLARLDVVVALGLAGLVNMAMLATAAKLFHLSAVGSLVQAHAQIGHLVGGTAAIAFAVALLASGISSSSVGTFAGQVVMGGFTNLRVPMLVRRTMTMAPALLILFSGASVTGALVLSQVILSFGIPLALIPLVLITGNRKLMGAHVNRRPTTICAWTATALVTALNVVLIVQALA